MSNIIYDAFTAGADNLIEYLLEHVLTCLVVAFFIAGAIAAFLKKDAILKYFGPTVAKWKSYSIAAVSGIILAVCSCTILPIFAGIYKKGSGIGPATAFLYSGPAINILAIVYTANVLGYDIGLARAIAAIFLSVVVGLFMALIFRKHDRELQKSQKTPMLMMKTDEGAARPKWVVPMFFVVLIAILLIGANGQLPVVPKLIMVYILTIALSLVLIYYFKRSEITEWGSETWDLTKKIFPILLAGTFVVGVIAHFLPPETFKTILGGESLSSSFFGAIIGAILYMPTLLEVPIIGTTFGYTDGIMGSGPALSLLLAGPAVSLPNMIVLGRIMGLKKTAVYVLLVVILSTIAGFVYGNILS